MIEQLKFIEDLKEIKELLGIGVDKVVADQKTLNLINKKIAEYQHEFDEFEKWAEAESQKDAYIQGYSEEHIKQMMDPRHNQWGSAGEPKKTRVQ